MARFVQFLIILAFLLPFALAATSSALCGQCDPGNYCFNGCRKRDIYEEQGGAGSLDDTLPMKNDTLPNQNLLFEEGGSGEGTGTASLFFFFFSSFHLFFSSW